MDPFGRMIFVCMDNTCRSMMAESVMRSVCEERKIEVLSRGLVVLFPEPMNPKAVAVLRGNGLSPSKEMSEPLEAEDLTEDTLVLTMTSRELDMVRERFPDFRRVFTLGAYAGQAGDIEEPHGGTLADYGACYEYIDILVKMTAEKVLRAEERGITTII